MILPPEVKDLIAAFTNEIGNHKRMFAHAIASSDMFAEVPHGRRMELYEALADEWNHVSGEYITARTMRYWIDSVSVYTKDELRFKFHKLTAAQLTEAVKLSNDCNITPQEICEWCNEKQIDSVAAMRAHWLPLTGEERTDPPALSGIIRLFGRLFKPDNPHKARIDEIIEELRSYIL